MTGVVDVLNRALVDAFRLENSIQRVRAVGYLAGQLVQALQFETLESRLAAVESALNLRGSK